MKSDGLTLLSGSPAVTNITVENGTTLPAAVAGNKGRLFYLTQTYGSYSPGLYTSDGTAWVTGDISGVTAGTGLTGGGTQGTVTLNVDTTTIATRAYVDGAVGSGSDAVLKTGSTMSGNLVFPTGTKATLADAPTNGIDAANKSYVDSVMNGLAWKASVRAASTAGATLSGTQTIDGVALQIGDSVLIKDQNSPAQNGVYVVSAGSWSYRSDVSTTAQITQAAMFVREGTVNHDTAWVCTDDAPNLGSTNLHFAQFGAGASYFAGTGLTLSANTFSVNLGAGVTNLPTGEVGVDLYTGGGLLLTADGTTASTATGSQLALATSGVTAATYGSSTTIPSLVVDAKGRVTSATTSTIPYDIASSAIGKPANGDIVMMFIAPRAFTIPANMTGSYMTAGTAATGSSAFTIAKNGSTFCTVTFAASGSTATFGSSSQTSFAAGDLLQITAPGTADSTLANIRWTIAATMG